MEHMETLIELYSTQGHAGQKLQRFTFKLSEENRSFLKNIVMERGQTMTEFINLLLSEDRLSNKDVARLKKMQAESRVGKQLARFSLALTVDNRAYVRTKARQLGISMTDFINLLLDEYKDTVV